MPLYTGQAGQTVPNYGSGSPPQALPLALHPGGSAYLFGVRTNSANPLGPGNIAAEKPASGASSLAVCLAQSAKVSVVPNVGLEIIFSANPGAFNLQLQETDTDADGCYITPSPSAFTITAATQIGVQYVARVDLGTIGSRFARLNVNSNPNNVGIIARLTMQ